MANLVKLKKLSFGYVFNQPLNDSLNKLTNLEELSLGYNFNLPLNNSLDKIRNSAGLGRLRAPNNVYNAHPPHAGMSGEPNLPIYTSDIVGPALANAISPSFFFDVQFLFFLKITSIKTPPCYQT